MKRHSAVQHSIYKGDVYVYIYIQYIYNMYVFIHVIVKTQKMALKASTSSVPFLKSWLRTCGLPSRCWRLGKGLRTMPGAALRLGREAL